jgi:hypothetical protein
MVFHDSMITYSRNIGRISSKAIHRRRKDSLINLSWKSMSNQTEKWSKEKEMKTRHYIAVQSCPDENLSGEFASVNNHVQRCMSDRMVYMLHWGGGKLMRFFWVQFSDWLRCVLWDRQWFTINECMIVSRWQLKIPILATNCFVIYDWQFILRTYLHYYWYSILHLFRTLFAVQEFVNPTHSRFVVDSFHILAFVCFKADSADHSPIIDHMVE